MRTLADDVPGERPHHLRPGRRTRRRDRRPHGRRRPPLRRRASAASTPAASSGRPTIVELFAGILDHERDAASTRLLASGALVAVGFRAAAPPPPAPGRGAGAGLRRGRGRRRAARPTSTRCSPPPPPCDSGMGVIVDWVVQAGDPDRPPHRPAAVGLRRDRGVLVTGARGTPDRAAASPATGPRPPGSRRLWRRELAHYPPTRTRYAAAGPRGPEQRRHVLPAVRGRGGLVPSILDLLPDVVPLLPDRRGGQQRGRGRLVAHRLGGRPDRPGQHGRRRAAGRRTRHLLRHPQRPHQVAPTPWPSPSSGSSRAWCWWPPRHWCATSPPSSGAGAAMGFWTLGPVLGSLTVSLVASQTLDHLHALAVPVPDRRRGRPRACSCWPCCSSASSPRACATRS